MSTIKSILIGVSVAVGLALAGCGGGGDACGALAKKLCEGKDDAYCQKAKAWLDSEMTGPDGKKLSASEANMGCKLIQSDKEALEAYRKQAAEKIQ